MADLYSVDIPQGGSGAVNPGAAGFLGLRQELLRQAGLARQAQMDEEQRQRDLLAAEVQRESLASLKEQRAAQTLVNTERADTMASTKFATTHEPGDELAPADKAVALRLFGPSAVKTTPAVPAMLAGGPVEEPTPEDLAVVPATAATPEKATFAGTNVQKQNAEHIKVAKAIMNGDYDTGNETLDQFNKARALEFLSTGKEGGSVPSGVIVPKTSTEKDATRYFNTRAAQLQKKPVTPEDAAFADAYEKLHPTEATKQQDALSRIHVTIDAANTRQQNQFANASAEEAFKELDKSYKDLNTPRLVKLIETLKTPGGVNDVVAVPEFLSSLAGGQGAGLRMSQAELNMIQNARPFLDSVIIKAGNIVGLNKGGYAALSPEQRAQMNTLIGHIAQHNYDLGQLYVDTQDKVTQARTAGEVREIKAELARHELELFGNATGTGKASGAGLPAGVTVTKRAK